MRFRGRALRGKEIFIAVRYDFDNDFNELIGPFIDLDDAILACYAHYHAEYSTGDGSDPVEDLQWQMDKEGAIALIDACCNGGYFEIKKKVIG